MKRYRKGISRAIISLFLCVLLNTAVFAETLPARSATAEGLYRHPVTGVIEDSGGDEQEALGQSMVTNVVDPQALVETNPAGGYYLSVRFHLMNSISQVTFTEQEPGDSQWKEVEYEETAKADDQADLRLPIDSEETIVKAECFVDAMGRSVLFFITMKDFVDGNVGSFVQMEDTGIAGDTGDTVSDAETEGLTIGGGNTAPKDTNNQDDNLSEEESAELTLREGEKIQMQQLNLSGGVWWMLFVIVFCATILGNLVMIGLKMLLNNMTQKEKQKNKYREAVLPEDEDFEKIQDVDIDWEASDNEDD